MPALQTLYLVFCFSERVVEPAISTVLTSYSPAYQAQQPQQQDLVILFDCRSTSRSASVARFSAHFTLD